MSRVHRVRATKVRQLGASPKQVKPGKAYNGPNLVAPREMSAKKTARKAAAGRKAAKTTG